MQPVTAEVHRNALEVETAGIAADHGGTLEDRDLEGAAFRELPGSAESGRTGAENDNRNFIHE